jgi:hypothetical protein
MTRGEGVLFPLVTSPMTSPRPNARATHISSSSFEQQSQTQHPIQLPVARLNPWTTHLLHHVLCIC